MAKFLTNNACLRCSFGSSQSNLQVKPNEVSIEGEHFAKADDALPLINIQPFGFCSAKSGPCVPMTVAWTNPNTSVVISEVPVITEASVLPCAVGGLISVESVPQGSVSEGS